jgi:hypothetical protein
LFDVARLLALAWALTVAVRARTWLAVGALLVVAYAFALEVASGFTIRDEGPQEPIVAMLLALIGPSAMPRGHLPAWLPLAAPVVRWPALVNAFAAVMLLVPARRLAAQIARLPQFSPDTKRADRVAVALYLVAVFEGISAATRGLPLLLSGG